MTGFVEVTLTIGVPVDAEYSPATHAQDIIENAKRLFPTADVMVQGVQTYPLIKPDDDQRRDDAPRLDFASLELPRD